MATPNVGILTNAGKNLIDQVNAGQTKITFSKIVFSSMNNNQLTDDQIKALTTVAPQEIVVNNPKVTLDNNTGETRIRATGNNEALTDGVYVKTYAVYAKDDSGNEILYGITVSPNPNYLPEYDGVTPQAVTYSYKVNISNTTKITFTNSNDIYVSDTDLAEAIQPYAKTVDVNQQLDKKVNVSDMRKPANTVAGIEEVNVKQDKIGYAPADDSKVVHTTDTSNWQKVKVTDDNGNIYSQLLKDSSSSWESSGGGWATPQKTISLTAGIKYFISAEFKCSGVNTSGIELQLSGISGTNTSSFTTMYGSEFIGGTDKGNIASGKQGFLYIGPFTPTITGNYHIVGGMESLSNTGYWRKITVTASNTYVPWEIAMANSISPIDNQDDTISINGKSYTPADDSKVVHNTVTQLNSTDMDTVLTAGFYQSISGTNGIPSGDNWTIYQVIPLSGLNGVQVAYETNNTILGMRSWNNSPSHINFTSWVQFADDSKVAHLSGANNFDTVPTVNNNPLLLASSLPSDLARTGSDQEFTGKNTFDTAPIDKTTGNPYITKDGVPSLPPDLARTGQAQTFTAAQTFSIAPIITDASKDKGDNQAATMADLKSLENSAWHQLKDKLGGTLLYKIDQSSKKIYMMYSLNYDAFIDNETTIADFSSIVKNIKTISGEIYGEYSYAHDASSNAAVIADLSIGSPASIRSGKLDVYQDGHIGFSDGTYFTYDDLQDAYK